MPDEPHNLTLQPGDRLGEYLIQGMLGKGGMGEVYLAEHTVMHKQYALKVLPKQLSASPHFISRFKIEARVMADLEHPNIVRVHHLGHVDDNYFLTMDFVEHTAGTPRTLEEEIRERGSIPEKDVVKYALQMCHALDYAHKFRGEGVIHRDLKPANVLLGSNHTIKIADFGIAKIVGAEYLHSMLERSIGVTRMAYMSEAETEAANGLTNGSNARESSTVQAIIGTYDYMSPEQKEGRPASPQSDIFALGVILYRMITGKKPEGIWEMPSAHGAHKGWDAIISTCMQREPKDRYYSVNELADALKLIGTKRGGIAAGGGFLKTASISALVTALCIGAFVGYQQFGPGSNTGTVGNGAGPHTLVARPDMPTKQSEVAVAPAPPAETASAPSAPPPSAVPAVDEVAKAQAENLRLQAELFRERLAGKNVNPDHGFHALLNILEMDWNAAERALGSEEFRVAESKYQEIIDQVTNIEELDGRRSKAVALQKSIAALRVEAEALDAQKSAMESFKEARQLETYSGNALNEAKFDEAAKGFELARTTYNKALSVAREAKDFQTQVAAYHKAITLAGATRINMIQKFESEKYQLVQQQVARGEDATASFADRNAAYAEATALFEAVLLSAQRAHHAEQTMLAARSAEEKATAEKAQAEKDRQAILAQQRAEEERAKRVKQEQQRMAEEKAQLAAASKVAPAEKVVATPPATTPVPLSDILHIPFSSGSKLTIKRMNPGRFTMGHNAKRLFGSSDEAPEHAVEFTEPFWMGIYEVTQRQYFEITGKDPSRVKGPELPVDSVSWQDAQDFCATLTKSYAEFLGSDEYEVRLPTEAEWEYACRAGTRTAYHSGNDPKSLDAVAWCALNAERKAHPVGTKEPNNFGLYDMHGNVWELCADYYEADYYRNSPTQHPTGPSTGKIRVARGGSFAELEHCRSADRWQVKERTAANHTGFRIVIAKKK